MHNNFFQNTSTFPVKFFIDASSENAVVDDRCCHTGVQAQECLISY